MSDAPSPREAARAPAPDAGDLRRALVLLALGLGVAVLSFAGNSPPAFMTFIAGAGLLGGAGLLFAARFLLALRRSAPRTPDSR